jgi:peptide/nickel transport system substrate-binding protein
MRVVKALAAIATLIALVVVAVGCGGAGSPKTGTTLNLSFSFDQGTLDPDVFYGSEGLQVTNSCYEGLLRYKDNNTEIESALAKDYEVSTDGLTYTFHLQPNVTFVDGSPLTSKVIKFDVERRRAIDQGPAYMVADVERVDTPDPLTVVMHLRRPVDPFLHFLASPYGLKAISEKAIKAHEEGDDWGQKWLADHCEGTGPYELSNVVRNQTYTMTAYEDYWGQDPYYTTVNILQIPSFTTQQLKLRSGELDLMTHGMTPNQIDQFRSDSNFQVITLPAIAFLQIWMNPHNPPLDDIQVRKAVEMAVDRQKLLDQVYGDSAKLTNSIDWAGTLPTKYGGKYTVPYDPEKAKQIVAKLPEGERKIDFVYKTDDTTNGQVAGLIAAQLRDVGFDAKSHGVVQDTFFSYAAEPISKRPNMLLDNGNPDDASPPSGPLLTWVSDPDQGFGYFKPYDPEADRVLYRAIHTTPHKKALQLYGKALDMYKDINMFIPGGNLLTTVVARQGITGYASIRQGAWLLDIPTLHAD